MPQCDIERTCPLTYFCVLDNFSSQSLKREILNQLSKNLHTHSFLNLRKEKKKTISASLTLHQALDDRRMTVTWHDSAVGMVLWQPSHHTDGHQPSQDQSWPRMQTLRVPGGHSGMDQVGLHLHQDIIRQERQGTFWKVSLDFLRQMVFPVFSPLRTERAHCQPVPGSHQAPRQGLFFKLY